MRYIKKIALLVILALGLIKINPSFAVSMGELKVYSYLNEPLNAEIILNGVEEVDTNNLIAELASSKDFMRSGIPKAFHLTKLKFEVIQNNKITVIRISTDQAMKNAYIDFLIQLSWPEGKIIKSYTILLDPAPLNAAPREKPLSEKQLAESKATKKEFSDAIFATSLEDSMENEISLEHKNELIAMANATIKNAPLVTSESDDDPIERNPIVNNSNTMLDKVASSLQVFAQPKRTAINYEKLLDIKPIMPVPEHVAMDQINSELAALRNNNNDNYNNINNNIIKSSENTAESTANIFNFSLFKKYGNDMLLACFLISATFFMFYKMARSGLVAAPIAPVAPIQPEPEIKTEIKPEIKPEIKLESQTEPEPFNAGYNIAVKNEEIELKIHLAKQYMETGNNNSAKEILTSLNLANIQENQYKEQIEYLLKCLG